MRKRILGISLITGLIGIIGIGHTYAQFGNNDQISGYLVPGAGQGTEQSDNDSKLLDVIQTAVNRVLGMLSLVALVLCLRGGFQMLTAGSDDGKVKSGTKILKNAALGLGVIGLSWLFVSFVFWIVNKTTGVS